MSFGGGGGFGGFGSNNNQSTGFGFGANNNNSGGKQCTLSLILGRLPLVNTSAMRANATRTEGFSWNPV
jgi:hypothetical protein